jgi:molecular chaperone HtpG
MSEENDDKATTPETIDAEFEISPGEGGSGGEAPEGDADADPIGAAASPAPDPVRSVGPATEHVFQAEVQKVLALVIDSLYANKEVFLRELVSNASDALDKARLFGATHEGATPQEGEPKITIRTDDGARTLTIEDNGVGMTEEEVVQNLGTIARSGTREFFTKHKDALKEAGQNLIGQFGVGFYAAFMVADRVDVATLSMAKDASPVVWRSSGSGSFSVAKGERTTPGTTIVLHLKEDQKDFLRGWRLKDVIKRYSDFVPFPIEVDGEVANTAKALWTMPKSQVTPEQHAEFYKHLTQNQLGDAPLLTVQLSVDAPVQYQALLYVPPKAPFDLFKQERESLRLYAKRVLIVESCDKLTPVWLRFLRGVVDSEDLSLNVSREMLQENATLQRIEQQLVKQVLKALADLAKDDVEKYGTFWKEFGRVLKEGVTMDWKNKDAILDLCRFESMKTEPGKLVSLKQYIDAMPSEQTEIYYVTGIGRRAVEASPHLEAFKKKGWDVLFLTDPIDEWVVQATNEFDKKKLTSIAHGNLDIGADEAPKPEDEPTFALQAIKNALGDKVKDVRFSKRLVDSASVLVADEGQAGANMERIMKMMDERAQQAKRILEVNPKHPVVQNLALLAKTELHSDRVKAYSELLLDQALLAEGVVENPAALVARIQDLLVQATTAAAASSALGTSGSKPAEPAAT